MDFLRKTKDWFKGAFGNDDDEAEKKRRQAEARALAQKNQEKQKVQTVNKLFKKPEKPVVENKNKVPYKPVKTVVVKPAPLPDKTFMDIGQGEEQNRKIFGLNAAALLPKSMEKTRVSKPNATITTNEDKFVAKFDKLPQASKKMLIDKAKEDSKAGNQVATNTLDALKRTNRLDDGNDNILERAIDLTSVPGRSIARVAVGIPQGVSGLYDLVSPGTGTSRTSKFINKVAEAQDRSAKEAGVEFAYKANNIPTEIASYFIPSSLAAKVSGKFPKGAKLTEDIVERVAKLTDNAGDAGKVRTFLANRMRQNFTLDEALEEAFISSRYIGQNAARGNDTSPASVATDVAMGVAGGLLFPTRATKKLLNNEQEVDDVAGAALTATAEIGDDVVDNTKKAFSELTDDELRKIADDVDVPAIDRKIYKDELARREGEVADNLIKDSGTADTPQDTTPTYQYNQQIKNIADREKANFERYINSNPDLTPQQIEAAQQATVERIIKLTDDLKQNRYGTEAIVDSQAQKLDETIQTQQATNAAVEAEQAAKTTPAPGEVVQAETPTINPEVAANNAYNLDTAYERVDSLTDRISDTAGETKNPLLKLFNFGREQTGDRYRAGVDSLRNKANDLIYDKTVASNNRVTNAPTSLTRLFFDKFGMKDADRLKVNTYSAAREANAGRVKAHAKDIEEMFSKVDDAGATARKLYQIFEEPDMLARMYGQGTPKLTPDDLLPEERVIYDRLVELNKVRNDVWWKIITERRAAGLLSDEDFAKRYQNYLKNQDGLHSPRIYDIDFADLGIDVKGGNSNKGAYMGRKDVAELPQDVIDSINANPAQSMLFRLQTGLDELGRIDAIKQLEEAGYIREAAPNKGWTQLQGQQYGSANGKFIDSQLASELENRHIFNSDAGQKASDLLDVYRNSIFGSLDRAIKRGKTAYSPGTFLGNVVSNPFFFNRGSGINPISQSYNMAKNVPALVRHTTGEVLDGDILEMQRLGIKIGNTADELVGSRANYQVLDDTGSLTSVKNIALLPNKVYAGADDLAKVSIYKTLKSRGMDSQTAALRVSQFTQDYGNAGRAVEMLADSPLLGAPFARFVPELLRLTKNNIIYNPVGTFAGLYGLAALQKELTKNSGETEEERAVRENSPGKVKIPFTSWVNNMVGSEGDISLDFPVGDSAINAARALGFNFPIEPGTDAKTSLLKNLAPFAIPFMQGADGDSEFQPQQIVTSMFLRPLAEQFVNKDFMGRTVDDPMNKIRASKSDGNETTYSDESEAKGVNRLYHLAMNYLPASTEGDAIATKAGIRDELTKPGVLDEGKDYYGKDRSNLQTLLRSVGIKIEDNSPEARKERVERNTYFTEDLPAVQSFLNENPDLRDTYWKLKSTSKDRNTLIKANDIITPERWQLIQSDKSGRLLDFLGNQEVRLHDRSVQENAVDPSKPIKPIDPLFLLNPEQQRTVINIMSRPTGDDKEAEQILRTEQAWFREFEENRRNFYEENQKFYDSVDIESKSKQNPRVEEYYNIKYPEQPPLVKQYFDISNSQGKDVANEWAKAQGDALDQQFAMDSAARLEYTNKKRKIEGYPPISEEVWNNDTYGYKEDGGFGFGFGGGSSRPYQVNNLGQLTNFTGTVDGYKSVRPKEMPNYPQALMRLMAGSKGNRKKPPIGASSRGQ